MEKYGEIPPRFTRAWWSYFWLYYKWYVLGGAFALFMVCMLIFQCTHRVKYDMTIVYAGHKTYTEEQQQKICDLAKEYVPDVNGDGKVNIYFQPLVFSDKGGNEEYDYAIQTKLDLTFVDEYAYIYLMDEIETALYMQRDTITDIFDRADTFRENGEYMTGDADGVPYAASLKGSAWLAANNIPDDDLYLMVRNNTYTDDEKNQNAHDGAFEFAKAISKE